MWSIEISWRPEEAPMNRMGMALGLVLILLCPVFLSASRFYPKNEDGHYLLERWMPVETKTLKKVFRRLGWGCLVVGLLFVSWFSVIFD